jgi:hypothetical protein
LTEIKIWIADCLTRENQKMNEVIWIDSRSDISLKSALRNLKFAIVVGAMLFPLSAASQSGQVAEVLPQGLGYDPCLTPA